MLASTSAILFILSNRNSISALPRGLATGGTFVLRNPLIRRTDASTK